MTLLRASHDQLLTRIAPLLVRSLKDVRRDAVESAMILCQGNHAEAARRLGISRQHLHQLLARWKREDGE